MREADMAKTRARQGHNSEPLTDDEKSALLHHHLLAIRKADKAAAVIKSQYDAARNETNKAFAACKGDLGVSRKNLEELLAALDMSEVEFRRAENERRARFSLAGLPMGTQLDMFATDTAGDSEAAYSDGYKAGIRADDPVPPTSLSTILHPEWMRGWHDGQAENGRRFALAKGVFERREAAAVEEQRVAVIGDEPEEEVDEDEALDDAARKLKRSGFMDRGTPETIGDEAPAAA